MEIRAQCVYFFNLFEMGVALLRRIEVGDERLEERTSSLSVFLVGNSLGNRETLTDGGAQKRECFCRADLSPLWSNEKETRAKRGENPLHIREDEEKVNSLPRLFKKFEESVLGLACECPRADDKALMLSRGWPQSRHGLKFSRLVHTEDVKTSHLKIRISFNVHF